MSEKFVLQNLFVTFHNILWADLKMPMNWDLCIISMFYGCANGNGNGYERVCVLVFFVHSYFDGFWFVHPFEFVWLVKVRSWSSLFSIGIFQMHTPSLRCSIQKLFQLFLLTFKSIWKTFDHVIVRVSFGNCVANLTEVMKHSILMWSGKWQFPRDPTFHITIYLVLPRHPSLCLLHYFTVFAVVILIVILHNSTHIKMMMNWKFLLLLTFRRIV